MAKPHPFFLVLLCLLLPLHLFAAFSPAHQHAYTQLLKLKVAHGRQLSGQLPYSAETLLLGNYADFLELCVQQDAARYDELLDAQEERLSTLEDMPGNDAWVAYSLAEVRMQVAMSKLLFGNRLSAAWDFRKAYLQYSQNLERHPDFLPNRKNLGLLQVLIGSVPDQYKWFLNIIGLKGSIKQGMANLKAATATKNPFSQEAQLLYYVTLHLTSPQHETTALNGARQMARIQKDNLLYRFVGMHLLKKSKFAEEALQLYLTRPGSSQYLSFPYLHHMAADLYLYRGNYDASVKENQLFLAQHKGQHYLKAANYKLYLAYALTNHVPQAKWYLQQVPQVGLAEAEEDRYAARYAERQEALQKPLMRARLHTDGGYYSRALQALQQFDLSSHTPKAVQAEYYYRKARIYHGQEALGQAIPDYERTITLSKGSNVYFAPNAALQLGYIYQSLGEADKARHYFVQALSYKNHEYKNSIDAKAKLALATL